MQPKENKGDKILIFEHMPVPAALTKMAIPTIVSQLITMIYNLADTFFIGQMDDPAQVAAATLIMPIFMMLRHR